MEERLSVAKDLKHQYIKIAFGNLIYIFNVIFLSWQVFDVLVLYWIENLWLVVFGFLRLLLGRRPGFFQRLGAAMIYVPIAIFALFSYAFFSMFILAHSLPQSPIQGTLLDYLARLEFLIFAAIFGGLQLYEFVVSFLASGRFRWINVAVEMRIIYLHAGIMLGGVFIGFVLLLQYGSSMPALVLLVILKISMEIWCAKHDRILQIKRNSTIEDR